MKIFHLASSSHIWAMILQSIIEYFRIVLDIYFKYSETVLVQLQVHESNEAQISQTLVQTSGSILKSFPLFAITFVVWFYSFFYISAATF